MTSETEHKKQKRYPTAKNQPNVKRFNDATFIQYELDKNATAALKKSVVSGDDLFVTYQRLEEQGYAVSLKFDEYGQCSAAFLRQTAQDGPNWGYVLTGRGSTPLKALKQLFYKHFEVMGELWEQFDTTPKRADIDD